MPRHGEKADPRFHLINELTRIAIGSGSLLVDIQQLAIMRLAVSEITRIINAVDHGDGKAADELLPLVYQELRRLAAQKMVNEAAGHTLQPTALVHEAWLRLTAGAKQKWDGRGHFFAAAAESMRRILIENARRKHALKRGVQLERVNLDDVEVAILADPEALLLVNEALEKLEQEDAEAAQLVKLRFFAGMTNEEAGQALGVSARTAKRYWTFARACPFCLSKCALQDEGTSRWMGSPRKNKRK